MCAFISYFLNDLNDWQNKSLIPPIYGAEILLWSYCFIASKKFTAFTKHVHKSFATGFYFTLYDFRLSLTPHFVLPFSPLLSKYIHSLKFSDQNFLCISLFSVISYKHLLTCIPSFYCPNNIWWVLQLLKFTVFSSNRCPMQIN